MMFKAAIMATMLTSQAASPPPPPAAATCITREQAGSMGVVGAALFVNIAQNACRRHLRPSAFLQSASGRAFVTSIVADGRRRLPAMLTGITATTGGGQGPFVSGFFRAFVTGMLQEDGGADWAEYADPLICRDADEMIAVMATLSPDQIGRFTGAMISLGDRMSRAMARAFSDRRSLAPVRIVPPPPAAGPGLRPRPLAWDTGWDTGDAKPAGSGVRPRSAPLPVPIPMIAAPSPPSPRPPRPPIICPDPE
jgi:hypothetical protein